MNTRTTKNKRKGMSLMELMELFPDEKFARSWFEKQRWGKKPVCPHCQSTSIAVIKNELPMPYRCRSCRKHFSVRTGMIMENSRVSLLKWLYGIYLLSTNLKGVSSMKIHRDLGITQKTAWLLTQKIRQAFIGDDDKLSGVVEVDETYIGRNVE